MLFYFLSLFPVYSEEVDLACGETTYCYLSENNLIIQPAYDKETDQPTTATELILKRIQTGSNSIPFNIYVSFNANPYQNDEVQHKFVAIGEYAFSQINTNLGSIDLPATITSIGPGAFVHCSRLSSITITKSVEVIGKDCFYNCKSLGSVTIPASLTSIGIDCFYGCYNLRELMDYSSFGDIGSYFPYVTGLYLYSNDQKYITNLPSSLDYFEIRGSGEITISGTIPSAVSSIYVSSPILNIASFGENTNIPSINIISQNEELTIVSLNSIKTISFSYPETIKKLTCKSCNSLENLEFSQLENLEEIMDSSFQKVKLNTISLPSKLKVIESNCFTNCNSLESISIPISCKQVGSLSFSNCEKLQTLEIPISTQFVEESTTYDEIYTNIVKDAFKSSPIKTITIYGSGELIYILMNQISNQFSGLETITLKEGITNIGENAFVELSTLTTLNIPSTVEFISGGAIQKCYNVEPIISIDNPFITYSEDVFYKIQNENKAKSLLTAIDNENSATSLLTAISRKDKNEFDIPEGVETIEKKAFYGNEFVETIILPYSTKSIGNSAFKKCPRLTKIIFKGIKEIEIEGSEIFDNPDQIVIKVPDEYEGNTLFGIEVERDPSIIPPIPDEDDSSSADEDNSLTPNEEEDSSTPNEEEDSSTPNEEDDSSTQEKNDPSTIEEIDPPTPEENGLNGGEIAGIVIAVLIIIAVVSFLIYWFAIRKRETEDSSESNIQNEVP